MQIFKAKAFTSINKIKGKRIIGNPAIVYICDKLPGVTRMIEFSTNSKIPMKVFVAFKKDNIFNIRFFGPDGTEINVCGHALFVASQAIAKYFKIKNNVIIYNLNPKITTGHLRKKEIKTWMENDRVVLQLPVLPIKFISKNDKETNNLLTKIVSLLQIPKTEIKTIFKSKELHDYIIQINNINTLRNLKPDFQKMIPYCKKLKCRGIFITCKSDLINCDYETRAFGPHIQTNEDIACGSINSIIAPFWSDILKKNKLKNIYSYHWYRDEIGGVQEIIIHKDCIDLKGRVSSS